MSSPSSNSNGRNFGEIRVDTGLSWQIRLMQKVGIQAKLPTTRLLTTVSRNVLGGH